jgi:hypothetical protein
MVGPGQNGLVGINLYPGVQDFGTGPFTPLHKNSDPTVLGRYGTQTKGLAIRESGQLTALLEGKLFDLVCDQTKGREW